MDRICEDCEENLALPRRKKCGKCRSRAWRAANPRNQSYEQDKRTRLKRAVVELYGGKCACCGETELVFLTFDHVDPIGNKNRPTSGGMTQLYDARKRHGDGYYQVLCFNCNFAKHWGGCPHQNQTH